MGKMRHINVPVLFLSGAQDELVPPQMMQKLHEVSKCLMSVGLRNVKIEFVILLLLGMSKYQETISSLCRRATQYHLAIS